MDGTETEFAQQWGAWLRAKVSDKRWSGADLRRRVEAVGGKVGTTQVSRWLNGEQRPSVKNAGYVADVLGVERREAWEAAGLIGDVGDAEGPAVISDPAEAFIRQIRARRRLPQAVKERLIAETREEIEQRSRRLEQTLDIVEAAVELQPEDHEPV